VKFIDVSRIRSRFDEPLTSRDGVRLSVDVYLPPEEGRYPALITRTPYDNNRLKRAGVSGTALLPSPADQFKKFAAHGFIVVAGDVRGRGDSDGSFVPFAHDTEDGADTVAWVRALPESNGRVGAFGNGYGAWAALAAATEAEIDAIAAWSPFGAEGMPFRGGAVRLDWLFWMHLVGGRVLQPVDVPPWGDIFRHRPLVSMHEALGREDAPWPEWLEGSEQLQALDLDLGSCGAAILFVTGWWDGALSSTFRFWDAVGERNGNALLVGPWDTEAVRQPRADVGGVAWGPSAVIDPDELLIEWFSAHLKGKGPAERGARVFLTGRNEWVTLDGLGTGDDTGTLWLTSGGRANTRRGDGRLVASAPGESAPDRFTHNPAEPVRWQRTAESFSRSSPEKLTHDTAFATSRDDVLVYEADPATSSVVISGRPRATLWVQSTAADADWVVALEDVFPGGGSSVHLAHGIVRTGAVAEAKPAQPVELTIELTPLAHELLPGHALRLLVASSLWPLYAVNLGGDDYLRDTEPHISEHTLFHNGDWPSRLDLPVRE
jgi:predicted acyl esterase